MAKEPKAEKNKDKEADKSTAPKKKKFKLIMIIVALSLLLIGGGLGAYWYLNMRLPGEGISSILPFGGSKAENLDSAPVGSEKYPNIPPQVNKGNATLVSLPPLVVNLADSSANRYLKISMDIEVTSSAAAQEVNSQSTRIRDSIILLLSSKTAEQLTSAEGKLTVKNEIASRINQVLGSPRVLRVYFTEFVIS